MKRIILAALLISTPALAQQKPPSAAEQALGAKLMQEIQSGLSCSAGLITAQADLVKANERIKALEVKSEPSK
jgi:hypothetical protein